MFGRKRGTVAFVLAGCLATVPATVSAEPTFERIGAGLAFASPVPALSLFGQLDDQWSGTLTLSLGAEVRVNYTREASQGGYWTAGGGYVAGLGVVRLGYGRAWQRGPWRWHVEATLNAPFGIDRSEGDGGLGAAAVAVATLLVPIGFGVHYVFGQH